MILHKMQGLFSIFLFSPKSPVILTFSTVDKTNRSVYNINLKLCFKFVLKGFSL